MTHILLSSRSAALLSAKVAAIMGGRDHRILVAEDTQPGARVDIAFVSREVTGRSTKFQVMPPTQHFYDLLRQSPTLAWVQMHSAGADRPIWGELRARGVSVTTASGANSAIVAHTTIAGLLALSRHFPKFVAAQRDKRWDQRMDHDAPRDLRGQTAVIVGWGPVARKIARLAQALGMNCIAVRRNAGEPDEAGVGMISFAQLSDHLPSADWLILACPLTDQTRALVDRASLARLPAGARLINVARGEVVVQADLIEALRNGQLAGTYLDVTDPEPLPADSPLWALDNVILTPHIAGHADSNEGRVAELFLGNLVRWRDGVALVNLVS